ncbi:MAG: hypothetical protein C0402_10550 [Thermodesulfovibrio sp.]|nr:hypothetical protein [Thermodesulfovibrio sp.]
MYFSFFAVSQVAVYCPDKAGADLAEHPGKYAVARLSVGLLEQLLQDTDLDQKESGPGTNKILLRKKRAVISAKRLIDPSIQAGSSLFELTYLFLPLKRTAFLSEPDLLTGRFANSPSSGLSPPTVASSL